MKVYVRYFYAHWLEVDSVFAWIESVMLRVKNADEISLAFCECANNIIEHHILRVSKNELFSTNSTHNAKMQYPRRDSYKIRQGINIPRNFCSLQNKIHNKLYNKANTPQIHKAYAMKKAPISHTYFYTNSRVSPAYSRLSQRAFLSLYSFLLSPFIRSVKVLKLGL